MVTDSPVKKCEHCGKEFIKSPIPMMVDENGDRLWISDCDCESRIYDEKQIQKELQERIKKSNIPKKYQEEDMKDWKPVPGTEKMTQVVKEYLQSADENLRKGRGVLIAGSVGTGKTKIHCYLLRMLMLKLEVNAYFLSSDEFSKTISEMKEGTREFANYMENLCNKQVLLFDDLGESSIPDWKLKHLTYIINQRYYKGRVTFFNTMKTMKELSEDYGSHIMSRICEMCSGHIVEVESKLDMRMEIAMGRVDIAE